MSGRLCFLDTETTSLRPDRRAWEIGLIVRDDAGIRPGEHHWFIRAEDLDLGNADPFALKIGRFYERHPDYARGYRWQRPGATCYSKVEKFTRGAHLVGAVPNFDAEVLGTRMRAHGILPSWHYHLVDIEPLAAGWLHRHAAVLENREATMDEAARLREIAAPPWNWTS